MNKRIKKAFAVFAAVLTALFCLHAQTNRYVWSGGGNVSPYTNWATAANNINDPVIASAHGDVIWVTNGVYDTGGRVVSGTSLTNRVLIDRGVTVRSVNGPSNTIIAGRWHEPGNPANKFGPAALRCVGFNHTNAVLIGFTLTNGATHNAGLDANDRNGGGAWGRTVWVVDHNELQMQAISNCVMAGNAANNQGGGMYWGRLYDCQVIGNSALGSGGGLGHYSAAHNCLISGNTATGGSGGAAECTLYNCRVIANSTSGWTGGAGGANMYNCLFQGNSAAVNGGAYYTTGSHELFHCTFIGNVAGNQGGACWSGTLHNCLLMGNYAVASAGGGYWGGGGLYNCTIVGNSAASSAGTSGNSPKVNGIIYYNKGGGNQWGAGSFTNCCSIPELPGGTGNNNITNEPMFIDIGSDFGTNHVEGDYRLQKDSPCVNAGMDFEYMSDPGDRRRLDLDGQPRIQLGTVDIGAYEFIPAGTVFIMRGQ